MYTALALVTVCLVIASAQQDGWKMTDRFYGFRYDMVGQFDTQMLETIQNKATTLGCFGWVQRGKESNIVGEGRCAKGKGKVFQDWLEALPGITRFEKLVYSDTKIRLHFSHFKILEPSRETCFLDKPHQCPDLRANKASWEVHDNSPSHWCTGVSLPHSRRERNDSNVIISKISKTTQESMIFPYKQQSKPLSGA